MSSVRMCDRCGEVFSERESGWQTFAATTVSEDDDGGTVTAVVRLDSCPRCAVPTGKRREQLRPRLAAAPAEPEPDQA